MPENNLPIAIVAAAGFIKQSCTITGLARATCLKPNNAFARRRTDRCGILVCRRLP